MLIYNKGVADVGYTYLITFSKRLGNQNKGVLIMVQKRLSIVELETSIVELFEEHGHKTPDNFDIDVAIDVLVEWGVLDFNAKGYELESLEIETTMINLEDFFSRG